MQGKWIVDIKLLNSPLESGITNVSNFDFLNCTALAHNRRWHFSSICPFSSVFISFQPCPACPPVAAFRPSLFNLLQNGGAVACPGRAGRSPLLWQHWAACAGGTPVCSIESICPRIYRALIILRASRIRNREQSPIVSLWSNFYIFPPQRLNT